jgi:hypothetical protein
MENRAVIMLLEIRVLSCVFLGRDEFLIKINSKIYDINEVEEEFR